MSVGFDRGHQHILVPAHAAAYLDIVFQGRVRESLPPPAADAVVGKASSPSDGHVAAIR